MLLAYQSPGSQRRNWNWEAGYRLSSAVVMGLRPTNRDENRRGFRRHPMSGAYPA